ncbi:MAG: polysaccharide deacetylase family protein [Alphaproteobacteria bacterium]|nr:polysaccharide deacetylase family protein [Alphaproteobacteria bacterium]
MMRVVQTYITAAIVVAVGVVLLGTGAAVADKQRQACSERKGILGVSRVVEIDTAGGLRFGNMQYKDVDFLEPGEIVLTFDDGPSRANTTAVLNALEAHCTKATFFMVGRMAVDDPTMVKEIDRRGHTIGTHSWSHKMQGRLSQSSGEKEVELGVSAVSLALGKPVAPFFRFPYLSDPGRMQSHLKERDHGIFSIDVDSLDFRTRSGATMKNRVMSTLKRQGKGIILMHDIQRSTAAGISDLLDELASEGYKVVHLVSKTPAGTLKDYDEMAEQEAQRRTKYVDSRPLAARSIVWPVSSASEFPAAQPLKIEPRGLFKGPLPEPSGIAKPQVGNQSDTASESLERRADASERPKSETEQPAAKERPDTEDWRDTIFRN